MKPKRIIFFIVFFLILLPACSKKKVEETIVLPPVSALSLESNWGVVTSNYLRMRKSPAKDASVLTGLTRGAVIEILSSSGKQETIEGQTAPWYSISMEGFRGWVFGAYIKSFTSKTAAESYAEELK